MFYICNCIIVILYIPRHVVRVNTSYLILSYLTTNNNIAVNMLGLRNDNPPDGTTVHYYHKQLQQTCLGCVMTIHQMAPLYIITTNNIAVHMLGLRNCFISKGQLGSGQVQS